MSQPTAAGQATIEGLSEAEERSVSEIVGVHDITLITGDRVRLTVAADGRQDATIVPGTSTRQAHAFQIDERDGHLFAIPADATGPVAAGILDRNLFNLTLLAQQGVGEDNRHDEVPLIITYGAGTGRGAAMQTARELDGFVHERSLESISGAAGVVAAAETAEFWRQLTRPSAGAAALASADDIATGAERLWLDTEVYADDEISAPQIGAPTAWDLGFDGSGVTVAVLDTGIDAGHPDLADRVTGEVNFTTSDTAGDRYGHGTHVASIAAGTGAASNGLRPGIAHDAQLLNVKVLGDNGIGQTSWVIDGAEWAAQQGADIANLSLSSGPTDGTDPAALALNALTDQYGILFVCSAGNTGPGEMTVSSPGTADRALSVGSVDRFDALVGSSSRGPRLGDFAIKPEITAPGLLIIAARASGTSLGTPVDQYYTRLSGTSMAAPHVAGAAAVLKEQHPGWSATQLKSALTSTAHPIAGASVYEQGSGRVDVARAVTQDVYAGAGVVNLGYFPWPHDNAEPVTKSLTYTNTGGSPVTLQFEHDVTNGAGDPPAAEMFSLSAAALDIPAGESRTLELTVNPTAGAEGLYGGHVTANDASGAQLVTAVGWNKEPRMVTLTVHGQGRDDRPATGISRVDVMNLANSQLLTTSAPYENGTATFRLPIGTYSVLSYVVTYDEPQRYPVDAALMGNPEIELEEDTTLTLDADHAEQIRVDTGHKDESTSVKLGYYRQPVDGPPTIGGIVFGRLDLQLSMQPMPAVATGAFEANSAWSLIHPPLDVRAVDEAPLALDPSHVQLSPGLQGRLEAPLVAVGDGQPEDYAEVDAAGKIALARWDWNDDSFTRMVAAASAEGVAVLLVYNDTRGRLFGTVATGDVPAYSLTQTEGHKLLELLGSGEVLLRLDGTAASPYLYDLMLAEDQQIPTDLHYLIRPDDVVTINTQYRADVGAPGHEYFEVRHSWRPFQTGTAAFSRPLSTPHERTEYVNVGDTQWQQQLQQRGGSEIFREPDRVVYPAHSKLNQDWFGQVMRPSATETQFGAAAARQGDTLRMRFPLVVDSGGHWAASDNIADRATIRLFDGDQLLGQSTSWSSSLPMRRQPADYRLEITVDRPPVWWLNPSHTITEYEFHSEPSATSPTVLPLLRVDYDIALDLNNQAPAHRPFSFGVTVDHQPGSVSAPIAGFEADVSYDDGTTWQQAEVRTVADGRYRVTVTHPEPDSASSHVSLRVRTWDTAGNRFAQETIRAYTLAAG